MKNKLTDLNDHLFAQLERLSDEELDGDDLKQEISRGKAVAALASQITETARLRVGVAKMRVQHGATVAGLLPEEPQTIEHAASDSAEPAPSRIAGPEHRKKPSSVRNSGKNLFGATAAERAAAEHAERED